MYCPHVLQVLDVSRTRPPLDWAVEQAVRFSKQVADGDEDATRELVVQTIVPPVARLRVARPRCDPPNDPPFKNNFCIPSMTSHPVIMSLLVYRV